MKTLWEIDKDLQTAFQQLIENEGELTDELDEILTINQSEFNDKANDYVWVIKNLEQVIELRKSEIDRLKQKNQATDNTISRLKTYLMHSLQLRGGKAKVDDFSLSIGKSVSVKVDEALINPKFCRFTLSTKLDLNDANAVSSLLNIDATAFKKEVNKTEIKKEIQQGVDIVGAELVESQHLTIR